MIFSIPCCMIDALGPERAVVSAIEEMLQDGAEAILSALNCTLFPGDLTRIPILIELPPELRDWLEIAARNEDAMPSIEFWLPMPAGLVWGGSALPGCVETSEILWVAA